jgi:hypothetical protein
MADDNPPVGRTGKPIKYMRYAVGEIVLVVIGILIALQINEWENHEFYCYLVVLFNILIKRVFSDFNRVSL